MSTYLLQTVSSTVSPFLNFAKTDCSFTNRLYHPGGLPLAEQKVDILAKFWFLEIPLGTFYTDKHGYLKANYKWLKLPGQNYQTFVFKTYQPTYGINDYVIRNPEVLIDESYRTVPLRKNVALSDICISLFECESGLPILSNPTNRQANPQQTDLRDFIDLARAAGAAETLKTLIDFLAKIKGSSLTETEVEEIQGVFNHKKDLTEAAVLDLVLNGICPNLRKLDGTNDYVSEVKWDGFELTNENAIPNGRLIAGKDEKENFFIKSITLQYRKQNPITYTPDSPDFRKALFKFNSIAFISGSSAYHLGTHFDVGQYAIAAFRTLRKNPIAKLLIPHLEGVLEINSQAATLIVQTLALSGMTENGVWQQLTNSLGGRCYTNFAPPEELSTYHRSATASRFFYSLVENIVESYFSLNEKAIEDNWSEIFYLSETLIHNSAQKAIWDGRPASMGDSSGKAISPVTKFQDRPIALEDQAQFAKDKENLKKLCKYVLYHATWGHWILHINEIEGMDPQFARIAPETDSEADKAESDNKQIALVKTLCGYIFGALVDNPNGDIAQITLETIRRPEVAQFLAGLGYDLNRVFRGVII